MKAFLLMTLGLFVSVVGLCQVTLAAKVLGSDSCALAYVNIGFEGTPMGTVSNKDGNFSLVYDEVQTSGLSLMFSILGYETCLLFPEEVVGDSVVVLQKKTVEIPEVTVAPNSLKEKTKGGLSASLINMSCRFSLSEFRHDNLGAEIGRKFPMSRRNTWLDSLHFFIDHNNYDTVIFRINIYDVKHKRPGESCLRQDVRCSLSKLQKGCISVDLTPYDIHVSEDIIVSLEWIYHSDKGNTLSLPIAMPSPHMHYYKYGSQNKWQRYSMMATRMKLYVRN